MKILPVPGKLNAVRVRQGIALPAASPTISRTIGSSSSSVVVGVPRIRFAFVACPRVCSLAAAVGSMFSGFLFKERNGSLSSSWYMCSLTETDPRQ